MTAMSPMDSLQSDIERLQELDDFRTHFMALRKSGREALKQFVELLPDDKLLAENKWQRPKQRHQSQVVKAMGRSEDGADVQKYVLAQIRRTTINEVVGNPQKSPLFINASDVDEETHLVFLDAAYALDALASAPEAVFSPATMYFYYFVVRELYYPTPPV